MPVLAKLKLFKSIYMLEGVAFGFPGQREGDDSVGRPTRTSSTQVNNPDIGHDHRACGVPCEQVALEFRYEGGFKQVDKRSADAPVQRNRSLSGVVRIQFQVARE